MVKWSRLQQVSNQNQATPDYPRIAVVFPSRGTTYSKTIQELLLELEPYKHDIFFSHNNPIPECFNRPLSAALDGDYTHIWFVEDDMILPPGVLTKMLQDDKDAVACDYPLVPDEPSGTILYSDPNTAFFTGTGCLLIKRHVFDKLPRPVFRTDVEWEWSLSHEGMKLVAQPEGKFSKQPYGLHDITFGLYMYTHGMPIHVNQTACGQRKLVKRGAKDTNSGTHEIIELNNLLRHDASSSWLGINRKDNPYPKLVEVLFGGKELITVTKEYAAKLIEKKQAIIPYIKVDNIILDFSKRPQLLEEFS